MWRLTLLKSSARKSIAAFSPERRVFLPKVKSSLRPATVRAPERERGSLPKVKAPGTVNAVGFQNGVVAALKFELLFGWVTPGTTFTRAIPVKWHPANNKSPAVPPQGPYTLVGGPAL